MNKTSITSFYRETKDLLLKNKTVCAFFLFYSSWIIQAYITSADLELKQFDGRMIGITTLNAYDATIRVSLFFRSLFLLTISFTLFLTLFSFLNKILKGKLLGSELKIIAYSSLAGIFFYTFRLFGFQVENSIEWVYFLHKLMLVSLILKFVFKNGIKGLSIATYSALILLSIALYFICSDLSLVFNGHKQPDIFLFSFAIGLLLISLFHSISAKALSGEKRIDKLLYVLSPFLLAPFASILKDEIYLIFKFNEMEIPLFLSWSMVYLMIIMMILYRIKKKKNLVNINSISIPELLSKTYFPLFVFSVYTYQLYQFSIVSSGEMFEAGNKYLPVMEFSKWGVVPILEKFNSHLLSDFFFSSIYSFFNGINGNEIELYDFMTDAINGLLLYYLVLFLSRNAYIALYAALFCPFYLSICPNEHTFMVFGILAFLKVSERQATFKNYLLFSSTLLFLILWKIDIGFASVFYILTLIILQYFFLKSSQLNIKKLILSLFSVFILSALITTIVSVARGFDPFSKFRAALNYLSSVQSYAYTVIGDNKKDAYQMHYFVFPALVLILAGVTLFQLNKLNISKKQKRAFVALIAIIIYYLANFQRGLVRHSLLEGIDTYASSFIYLILIGSIFVLTNLSHTIRFISYGSLSLLLITNYKYPKPEGSSSVLEKISQKTLNSALTEVRNISDRSGMQTLRNSNLIDFMNDNLGGDQTFLDFTDSPMLYYFTQKRTPSYFFQNPICSHNDFLQEYFVKDLAHYDIPYVIFSRTSGPRTEYAPTHFLRYKIAEYIYQNYSPHLLIDGYRVWKKNALNSGHPDTNKVLLKDDSEIYPDHILLTKLPHIWGTYDHNLKNEPVLFNDTKNRTITSNASDSLSIPQSLDKTKGNHLVLHLNFNADTTQTIRIHLKDQLGVLSTIEFDLVPSEKEEVYLIRLSSLYKWYARKIDKIVLENTGKKAIQINRIQLNKAS